MKIRYVLILMLALPFILNGVFSNGSVNKTAAAVITPTPTPAKDVKPKKNAPADVVRADFDKKLVYLWCKWSVRQPDDEVCSQFGQKIKISAGAIDAENDALVYRYEVTGGKIYGEGANVVWNLHGLRPGQYTIKISADDGSGATGKTLTERVSVTECPICDPPCSCPTLMIEAEKETVKAGETIEFTAIVAGREDNSEIKYKWRIVGGKIVAGQGTSKIKARTPRRTTVSKLAAIVEIGGTDPACNCPTMGETGVLVVR